MIHFKWIDLGAEALSGAADKALSDWSRPRSGCSVEGDSVSIEEQGRGGLSNLLSPVICQKNGLNLVCIARNNSSHTGVWSCISAL